MAVMAAIEEGQIRANGPGLRAARTAVDAYLSRAGQILAEGGA